MFIVARFWKITLVQAVIFVLFYLWLRGRYGGRRWFRTFRWFYASGAVLYILLLWAYLWVGRASWPLPGAAGWPGDLVLWFFLASLLQGAVLLPMLLLAVPGRFVFNWARRRWQRRRGPGERDPDEVASATEFESGSADADRGSLSRRGFLAKAGLLAGLAVDAAPVIGTAGVLSGMFLGSRQIETGERPVVLHGLHDDLKGLRVVQISDIHAGSLINEFYLKYVIDLLASARGDLLVVTGDLIDFHNRALGDVGRFLDRAAGLFPYGAFVVPGNHDYFYDGEKLKKVLRRGDFRLMLNETFTLERGRGRLEIVGLDYPWPYYRGPRELRRARSQEFFRTALETSRGEGPRILLNHDPAEFVWIRAAKPRVDLMLSGHTHGGQVHVPGPGGGTWVPAVRIGALYPYVAGPYLENGRTLYVNRGLGHTLPLRIDCPPEISVFELI